MSSLQGGKVVVILFAILLVVLLIVYLGMTVLGLPGNWLSVLTTGLYAWLVPAQPPLSIGLRVVLLLVALAALGEVVEFLAGAAGASKSGGSKRGIALALVGSLVGSIVGLFVGLPIPVVGSVLASLLFAAVGALLGAFLGEVWKGRSKEESLQIGMAAFRGRMLGTLGKLMIGFVMLVVVIVALLV